MVKLNQSSPQKESSAIWTFPQNFQKIFSSPWLLLIAFAMSLPRLVKWILKTDLTQIAVSLDTSIYYGALTSWMQGGSLYSWVLSEKIQLGFTYTPFAALVMSPLTLFSTAESATLFMMGANFVFLALLVIFTLRSTGHRGLTSEITFAFLLFPLMYSLEPISRTFYFGQIDMFLLNLMLLDVAVLRNTKFFGMGTALAAAIKVIPAIFILYFVVRKDWASTIRFVATGLASVILSFALMPQETWQYFTQTLYQTDRVGKPRGNGNYSLLAFFSRLNPDHPAKIIWGVVLLIILVFVVIAVLRTAHTSAEIFGYLAVGFLGVIASPISWQHHWVWCVPALLAVAITAFRTHSTTAFALLISGYAIYAIPYQQLFGDADWVASIWPWPFASLGSLPMLWSVFFIIWVALSGKDLLPQPLHQREHQDQLP